ncbi:MAG TPA: endolytic transglycosylase MltG [Gammaproteobacteria bacterium]|nr:endolytic transglycosylase MltG [Gammaproteobacteria bacterium]
MKTQIIKYSVVSVLVLLLATGAWLITDYNRFLNSSVNTGQEDMRLEVRPGQSLRSIAGDLYYHGMIEDKHVFYFRVLARLRGNAARIHIGEYLVRPGTTPAALLDQLSSGKVMLYSQTIIEGWRFRQMIASLRQNPAIVKTVLDKSDQEIMAAIGHPEQHPEGRFLPETYRFPKGTRDTDFLKRVYDAMATELNRQWQARAKNTNYPLETAEEMLILASIVEKETGVTEERPQIAGVFIRRLLKNMRLQTDPTVIYGMGDKFKGNLRRRDLRRDTPYNTYTRKGLPPTPIALPGRGSLYAVGHPDDSKTLYFVARGDGRHKFAETLDQHNNNVIKYQLGGRARPFSSMPANKKK